MRQDAFVFGDLSWAMPDPGMIAVWRAMPLDAARWTDWEGFVDGLPARPMVSPARATIGQLVDQIASAPSPTCLLELTETGVRLRARIDHDHAERWQAFAVAWRLAGDLGASGEFAWCPCTTPCGLAYRAVIRDYDSRWEKLTGTSTSEVELLAGRREVEDLVPGTPVVAPAPAPPAATVAATSKPASQPAAAKPGKRAARSAKPSATKKPARPKRPAGKKPGKQKRR